MEKTQPPMRFTEAELLRLKQMFGGKEKESDIKLLRKIFLPEYDPHAPFEQNIDLWMTVDIKGLSPEQAMIRFIARNETILHVERQLVQIAVLANREEETEEQKKARLEKDSMK